MSFFRKFLKLFTGHRVTPLPDRHVADNAPKNRLLASKEEQIEALLSGRAQELVSRLIGEDGTIASYDEVFTVSQKDVEEYVKCRGVPSESFVSSKAEAGLDGWMHCIREGNRWHVYWQERGSRYFEQVYDDKESAMQALAYELASRSGTGIVALWERH